MTHLALRIIVTIFLTISSLVSVFKNDIILDGATNFIPFIIVMFYGLLWRALAIATVWVL